MEKQVFWDWVVHYNLRVPNGDKACIIYAVVKVGEKQIKVNTGVKVYPNQWDKYRQLARLGQGLTTMDNRNNTIVNNRLMAINAQVADLKLYLCDHIDNLFDTVIFDRMFRYFINSSSRSIELNNLKVEEVMAAKKIDDMSVTGLLLTVVREHYEYNQGIKQKISEVKSFGKWLEMNGGDRLDNLSKNKMALYEKNLCDNKLAWKTIKTKIGHLMSIIRIAREYDYIAGDKCVGLEDYKLRTKAKIDAKKQKSFALTSTEVNQLYNCSDDKLTVRQRQIRDIFVLQCEMGQRVGDTLRILKGEYEIKSDFLELNMQQKTKTAVAIPLTNIIRELLSKYKNGMSLFEGRVESTVVNYIDREIKVIAEKAGLNRMHNFQGQRGEEVNESNRPLFKIITSHIARHTFITEKLRLGWDKDMVKTVTGHTSDEEIDKTYSHLELEDRKKKIIEFNNAEKEPTGKVESSNMLVLKADEAFVQSQMKKEVYDDIIQEAKEVLSLLGEPSTNWVTLNDIDELFHLIYKQEAKLEGIGFKRRLIKDIKKIGNLNDKYITLNQIKEHYRASHALIELIQHEREKDV